MRVPTSTYRLQVRSGFDLVEAARRLPYLHDLGVDWVYLSPILEAEPGSDHGYDVVDTGRIDPARGGAEGFAALVAEARRLGLGVLVDIVPNHVGVATPKANAWWWSLLSEGPSSPHAAAFDVDWDAGGGKVLLPVLDDSTLDDWDADALGLPPDAGPDERFYEPVHWKVADHGLNYRRFFAVNTLAGVRVEDPEVFEATHTEIRRWFDEGLVDGLRVDHPDGLRDPKGYLDDLARLTGGAYVLVEKILEPGEELPTSWATAGTTGYDALGLVDRVLTDPAAEHALPFADLDYAALVRGTKREVADTILGSEVRRVVREYLAAAGRGAATEVGGSGLETSGPTVPGGDDPSGATGSRGPSLAPRPDELTDRLVDAVAELAACFPVYRSYLPEGREHLDQAFAAARLSRPDLEATFDELLPVLSDPDQPAALRFQQATGAIMAKGVEDCAFYRYPRLTSLNEVGGDPAHFSLDVAGFHAAMAERQTVSPHAMTALSTHDTKRGEDVRARITVLAEVPELWTTAFDRLQELAPVPSAAFACLLWQAVVGAWAVDDADLRPRLHAYAEKAMREAGDHTTWTAPVAAFEDAVHAAVDAAFDHAEVREVVEQLHGVVVGPGVTNGLAAKLLALTMPGVPDVYQGSELWELSLVDPDNRRPVEFDLRAALLAGEGSHSALPKLRLTAAALRLRRDRPELFTTYAPVAATGEAAGHVVAFDRGGVITVVTRLPHGLEARGGWGDTRLDLPPGTWRDLLDDETTDGLVGPMLGRIGVALLVKEQA